MYYILPKPSALKLYDQKYQYVSRSKSSKPRQERRAIVKHLCCSNPLPLLIKLEKTNSASCLNFCAGETHTKVRGVQQI